MLPVLRKLLPLTAVLAAAALPVAAGEVTAQERNGSAGPAQAQALPLCANAGWADIR